MEEHPLLYHAEDKIGIITINRPSQGNAITGEMVVLFHHFLEEAEKNDSVRALLLTGAGDRAFCTGGQLSPRFGKEGNQDPAADYAGLLNKLVAFPKPTVARIMGSCLAGGMGLMLACDIAIASEGARFGTPEINVGLWPMMIGALIFRNVLQKKAMEMILLGGRLSAHEALAMGLITRVVPENHLDEEIQRVLTALITKSPIGIRLGKQAFYEMADMPLKEALSYLSGKLKEVAATEDAREGIAAYQEKRPPLFKGR
jgi:enoyl-CoA hydratase/carnithine racemase